ncbi:unnamed protein product [Adineta ricciae]|uniref:Uncharacterized protein n=2 Tax=Adineta ricciae TaxID=249248 RepID=A0A814P4B3_ADIRI|nr:unnamed protein product [Adineta ricciae]
MLSKVHRFINTNHDHSYTTNNRLTSSLDRIDHITSSDDENNVYTQTLLYIVHVDEIESTTVDGQQSNKPIRKVSKRTTASFNEQQEQQQQRHFHTPKLPPSTPPSFSFSNPFRRLNNLLKAADKSTQSTSTPNLNVTPLSSSTTKKSSLNSQLRSQNQRSTERFPPPPPEFFADHSMPTKNKQMIIRASGPGLKDGYVDDHCHFDLNARDAELQKLVIAIDGPSKADIQIQIVETGIYRVYYKCQLPGNYHLSLTYDGHHIDRSPYHLILHTRPSQEQIVPPANTPVRAKIEPAEFCVNTPCIVNIYPEVACNVFQAYVQAPQGNINLPIIVHKSAKTERYEVYFIPKTCGNHWLNVNLNHTPIVDNPYRLVVQSCATKKSMLNSKEELFHAYTGELSQFFVSKSPSSKTGPFSVGISGPSTVFLDANETEYGYEFHYKPIRSGKYLIAMKTAGNHIQGSPFLCRVYDKANDTLLASPSRLHQSTTPTELEIIRSSMTGKASQICVFGAGLYEAKKQHKATFKIDASQAGPGLLSVGLYSPLGVCERLVIKRIIPSSPGFIYKVSYRVRTRGQYMLTIVYGADMEHVPGSPYLVLVE